MTGPWRPGFHGQSLKLWIRSTCRRLKEIADQTAIGKIAYLLRKRDPMWARLHKGAVRQGLRSASAILAWMETNLQRAKTKTRLPTVVKLDTGNNFHSLDGIDDLKKVNLFDEKKIELDFKIEDNIAAAAFFTRYKVRVNSEIFFHQTIFDRWWPRMTTFLVCLHSPYINGTFHPQPVQNGILVLVVTTIAMIATQFGYENQIEIYLLIFQCMIYSTQVWSWLHHDDVMVTSQTFVFLLDNVVLGKLQINKNFIALYLPCMDIILLFDIAQVRIYGCHALESPNQNFRAEKLK